MKRYGYVVVVLLGASCSTAQGSGDYQALVRLYDELREARRPTVVNGLPEYTPATVSATKKKYDELRSRFRAVEPTEWAVPERVDYLLVQAQLDAFDFDLRVLRPWSRDPAMYVEELQEVAVTPVPLADGVVFRTKLDAVPRFLEQAKSNLTEAGGEHAKLALRNLEKPDGVGHGQPYRAAPPAGVRGWYSDIRAFLREQGILTIPDYVKELDTNVPWIVRPGGKRNFWEEVQYRDPRPDHVHAVIPGHRFDGLVKRHDTRPIRGTYQDSGRTEGWGFYLEEMMMQAGLLDDRPRTLELYYIFMIGRAVRNAAEVKLHTNEWTIADAVKYMVDNTPFMDEDVARVDAEIYLRRPTYGVSYQMGKIQIDQLVTDRALQLDDKFSLKEFHDQFLAAGTIPVSLIRWEMTGLDDEVKAFFPRKGGKPPTE